MEPTIYKPGAYKTLGVYKGTDGIYNGRGVYNDGTGEFVEIGGRSYPVVTIGSEKWIAENLDFKFNGLNIGGIIDETTNPSAWYYNNDEITYGENGKKYGLLYNHGAIEQLQNFLPTGWRVPTLTDIQNLANNSADVLKSKSEWISINGTNETGFNAFPSGCVVDRVFQDLGYYFNLWSDATASSYQHYELYIYNNSVSIGPAKSVFAFSARICKDA